MKFLICASIILLSACNSFGQKRVVILDTGLNLKDTRFQNLLCKEGHKDFSGYGLNDANGHGTAVAGLIKQNAGAANYCFIIVKFYHKGGYSMDNYLAALDYIYTLSPDIVNISGGGENWIVREHEVIRDNPKTLFIVAAGNDNKPFDDFCPACYLHDSTLKNLVVVGALDNGRKASYSNYGSNLTWEEGTNLYTTLPGYRSGRMSGTSMACAVRTGKVLSEN